ncbi:MAG: hypothetical protein II689_03675 [Firmicutes bacterium]|nr:hypothetical protein [Bacillota bacterium]
MDQNSGSKENKKTKSPLATSFLLLALAVIMVVGATVAWFTIADTTRLQCLLMDVTAGRSIRFDLDPHAEFEQYLPSLSFEQIADRIVKDYGYDMRVVNIEPVTTDDGETFRLEKGQPVANNSGKFVEFTLHFMALEDVYVHLTSESSHGRTDGTRIWSNDSPILQDAMRVSFSHAQGVQIYDAGWPADTTYLTGNRIRTFGLYPDGEMVYSDDNFLFFLKALTDYPVVVRIWMEGTDPVCTNALKNLGYSIQMRFQGTDENSVPVS